MIKFKKFVCALILVVISSSFVYAQKDGCISPSVSIDYKSSHIWRGIEVSDNSLLASKINLGLADNLFKVGVWGATTFSKHFKEFDYYVGFAYKGFSVEYWDIYNYSDGNGEAYNITNAFDYKAKTTGRFGDLTLAYKPDFAPLALSWSTVVFGRDRGFSNEKNIYSTYVELGWDVFYQEKNFVGLNLSIGGAFALSPEKMENGDKIKNHFFADKPGIVNVCLKATKDFQIADHTFPVGIRAVWNPVMKKTMFEASVGLFSF